MLYLICPLSHRYKEQLDKLCSTVGIKNYQIIDPASYSLDRSFKYVILIGAVKESISASQVWQIESPELELSRDKKMAILKTFQLVQKFVLSKQDKSLVEGEDIPRLRDLEEFLEEFKGQVMELRLPDSRLIGIYPDGERLQMKYSTEFHASTIINLARIKDLFDVQRVIIKDL